MVEMIGVQTVASKGLSGGPLIACLDEPGSFLGIGRLVLWSANIASSLERHEENNEQYFTGVSHTSVDNPAVIAMYLQFILPRYPLSKSLLLHLTKIEFPGKSKLILTIIDDLLNGT